MPWNLKLSALCAEDPSPLLQSLSQIIYASGGWVLSRSCSEREVRMSFEFDRSDCIEVYTSLIAVGLELSHDSHQHMTALCQCTQNLGQPMPGETVEVDLEVLARAQANLARRKAEELETA